MSQGELENGAMCIGGSWRMEDRGAKVATEFFLPGTALLDLLDVKLQKAVEPCNKLLSDFGACQRGLMTQLM